MESIRVLQKEIEKTRHTMMRFANRHGYTDTKTLAISEQLDDLVNKYQQLQEQNDQLKE